MGFSVTVSSAIIFISLIAFGGAVSGSLLYASFVIIPEVNTYVETQRTRLDIQIDLAIESISNSSCVINVSNKGSRTIFMGGGHDNTMIISYGTSWKTFLVEDYDVLEIKVSGTNSTFDPNSHRYINPGEEASIEINIPSYAPDIPLNATVIVVFASHYGVSTQAEGVR